jgi:hypothetical protein
VTARAAVTYAAVVGLKFRLTGVARPLGVGSSLAPPKVLAAGAVSSRGAACKLPMSSLEIDPTRHARGKSATRHSVPGAACHPTTPKVREIAQFEIGWSTAQARRSESVEPW